VRLASEGMDAVALACAFTFVTTTHNQSVTAVCPMPVYRVVARCGDLDRPEGGWVVRGPLAGGQGSTATCRDSRIIDYVVQTA
jgi:hypothetical protein